MSAPILLALAKIRLDGGTQSRIALNEERIADYAERVDDLPPAVVFRDGDTHWLADGFHRWHAFDRAGRTEMPCEVRTGTQSDAVWFSCAANKEHDQAGQARTNADKRRAVERALKWLAERGENLSDNQIAAHVGVTDMSVRRVRAQLQQSGSSCVPPADQPRKGKDGKTRKPRRPRDEKANTMAEHDDAHCASQPEPASEAERAVEAPNRAGPSPVDNVISFQESRVVALLRAGRAPYEIASELGIKAHKVHEIRRRLGIEPTIKRKRGKLRNLIQFIDEITDTLGPLAESGEQWRAADASEIESMCASLTEASDAVSALAASVQEHIQSRAESGK